MESVKDIAAAEARGLAPVQVNDREVVGDDAFEIIVGYAFADVPLRWRHERGFVGSPIEGTMPRWAYRNYDCVPADEGSTHKVLHHKRPRFFPLLDNETCKVLSDPKRPWSCIHRDLTATPEGWAGLEAAFAKLAAERGTLELTRLRLHDILLWSDAVGQRNDCRRAGAEILGR